jgi:hypothetical protein
MRAKHDVGVAFVQLEIVAKHSETVELDANVGSSLLEGIGNDASVGHAVARHVHVVPWFIISSWDDIAALQDGV